jgi:hypothetical protein
VLCFTSKLRALAVSLVIILTTAYSLMMQLSIYIGCDSPRAVFCPVGRTIVVDDLLRRPFAIFFPSPMVSHVGPPHKHNMK